MKLPEKWAIKTDNPEFYEFFNQLPNVDKGPSYPYSYDYWVYKYYPFCIEGGYAGNSFKEDYTLITFEQLTQSEEWKNWKLKKEFLPNTPEKAREIIGYKAPFDMFVNTNIEVIKDTIFTKSNGVYWNEQFNVNFPAEWVEKDWEPVYKETKEDVEHEIDLILGCYSTSTFKDKEEFNRVIEKLKPLFKKLEEL